MKRYMTGLFIWHIDITQHQIFKYTSDLFHLAIITDICSLVYFIEIKFQIIP